jgi:ketosteroid isomerase-like protein
MTDHELIQTIYAAFNHRDIDTVLNTMHPDVDWPNGMEGGRIYGREAVRQYWLRQWSQINPVVEPRSLHTDPTGAIAVEVHQVIRDLAGSLLADRMVQHVYRIEDGVIRSMEIRETPPSP